MILLMNVDKDNPSVAEGESVQIQGAGITGFEPKGNTEQDSYTGKNLLNDYDLINRYNIASISDNILTTNAINSNFSVFQSRTKTQKIDLVENTKYYVSFDCRLKSGTYSTKLGASIINGIAGTSYSTGNTAISNPNMSSLYQRYSFECISNITTNSVLGIQIQVQTGLSNAVFEIKNVMISTSSDTAYEEYTGNQPSPSPDYPQPVKVVTGDNTINVHGKNLAKVTNTDIGDTTYSLKISNGLINITTTGSNNSFDLCGGIRTGAWLPNYSVANDYHLTTANQGTYKVSIFNVIANITGTANQNLSICTNKKRIETYITPSGSLSGATVFTLEENEYIKSIYLWTNGATTIEKLQFNLHLEQNPTATEYQPYQSQTYPLNLGSIELCKIGDYQDYIYKENNKWYKHSEIGKVVLDGSENWTIFDTGTANTSLYGTNVIDNISIIPFIGLSNYFVNSPTTLWAVDYQGLQMSTSNTDKIRPRINKTIAPDVATLKNWLSTHNTEVYYVLATPTNTEITDTELKEDLEAINNIALFEGVNNISMESSNLTSSFKVYYDTWYEFDKILRNGYNIREDRDRITQKFANGHRKQFVSDYVDCSITLNLDTIDKDTTQDYLQRLKSGAYKYYSIDGKEYRTAQFIIENKPELSVESSISNNVDVNEYQITLLKAGD